MRGVILALFAFIALMFFATVVSMGGEKVRSETIVVCSQVHYFDGQEPKPLLESRPKDWYVRVLDNGTKVVYKEDK